MRALSTAPLEQRAEVWQRTVEATGGNPTAAAVKAQAQAVKAGVGDEVLITAPNHPRRQMIATITDDTDGVFVADTDKGLTGLLAGQFEIITKAEPPPQSAPSRVSGEPTMNQEIPQPTRPLNDWSRAELTNRLEELEELLSDILTSATTPQRFREKIRDLLKR